MPTTSAYLLAIIADKLAGPDAQRHILQDLQRSNEFFLPLMRKPHADTSLRVDQSCSTRLGTTHNSLSAPEVKLSVSQPRYQLLHPSSETRPRKGK